MVITCPHFQQFLSQAVHTSRTHNNNSNNNNNNNSSSSSIHTDHNTSSEKRQKKRKLNNSNTLSDSSESPVMILKELNSIVDSIINSTNDHHTPLNHHHSKSSSSAQQQQQQQQQQRALLLIQYICAHCYHTCHSKWEFEKHMNTSTATTMSNNKKKMKTEMKAEGVINDNGNSNSIREGMCDGSTHQVDHQHHIAFSVSHREFYCFSCQDFIMFENDCAKLEYLPCLMTRIVKSSLHKNSSGSSGSSNGNGNGSSSSSGGSGGGNVGESSLVDGSLTASPQNSHDSTVVVVSKGRKRKLSEQQQQQQQNLAEDSAGSSQSVSKLQRRDCDAYHTQSQAYIGLRGLNNLGNTCFMNCVLQSLCHNPLIRNYFLGMIRPKKAPSSSSVVVDGDDGGGDSAGSTKTIHFELQRLMREIYSGSSQPFSPHSFLYSMWNLAGHMAGYQQQDAHEFLMAILDAVSSNDGLSAEDATMLRVAPSMFYNSMHKDGVRGILRDGFTHKSPTNIIDLTFRGVFQSDLICSSCGHTSTTYDPFLDISLQLKTSDMEELTTLSDCLHRYTREENLGRDVYFCETCKAKRASTKQLTVRLLPQVLCLHLKRFAHGSSMDVSGRSKKYSSNASGKKISSFISFPLELDMSPYMSHSKLHDRAKKEHVNDSKYHYSLFSVIQHKGSMDSGHYTSYIKHDNKWYLCDDSMIYLGSEQDVMTSQAYLLFYVRNELQYRHS